MEQKRDTGKVDWAEIRKRRDAMEQDPAKVSKRELWKAIRIHCMDCAGDNHAEVRRCAVPECGLFKYRFGRPPAKVLSVDLDGRLTKPEEMDDDSEVLETIAIEESLSDSEE